MIILDSTTKSITLILAETTSNNLYWVSSWVDMDVAGATFDPKSLTGNLVGGSASLVTSPISLHQNQVKYISVYNSDTVNRGVSIIYNDNSNLRILFSSILATGDTLYYVDTKGFYIINKAGEIRSGVTGPTGLSGLNGTSGYSGTSGSSGISGVSGTSGINGSIGGNGTSGSSGATGANGTSGINGSVGGNGTSGSSGAAGIVGTSGSSGSAGVVGTSGTSGSTAYVGSTINTQTASYTLVLTDNGKLVEQNVATANNVTIPLNSSVAFPIGTIIDVTQYGAGIVSIVATGGVTIRSANSWLRIGSQYSIVSLIKRATDEWYLFGDIMP